ncbi:MAG TPA: VOC family protein [Candidatus Dormibacteraeota bacterium]|nr:VOC family protein [Candidatus Dormibacteraeota bacterium]
MGKLDAVGIVVTDLARAVKFYRLLGAPFEAGAEDSEHGHAEATLDGGIRLMLDTEEEVQKFDPSWKRAAGAPTANLAFNCDTPKGVDELYVKAISAGARVHKEPFDAFWGQRYAQVRDHDGNGVDLYANLPSQS